MNPIPRKATRHTRAAETASAGMDAARQRTNGEDTADDGGGPVNSHARSCQLLFANSFLTSLTFMWPAKTVAFLLSTTVAFFIEVWGTATQLLRVQGLLAEAVGAAFVLEFLARVYRAVNTGWNDANSTGLPRILSTLDYLLEAVWDRCALYVSLLLVLLGALGLHNMQVSLQAHELIPSSPKLSGAVVVGVFSVVFVLLFSEAVVWVRGSRKEAKAFMSRLKETWSNFRSEAQSVSNHIQ